LYRYKPHKDTVLLSVATRLDRAGVTPNQITALGLCFAFSSGLAALRGHLYTGIILFAIAAFFDVLDGSVARGANRSTEFGLYFDGIADRFSELFFVVGAVFGAGVPPSAFFVIGGAFTLLFARVYGRAHGRGPVFTMFGRPERLALLVVGILSPAPLNTVLFVAAALCCVISSAQILALGRFRRAKIGRARGASNDRQTRARAIQRNN
jgi:CDP-diacylglycerol--glycerol-3-phosphate 3-phosphatidyltransferase